jgi:hypothetical protein
MEAEKMAIRVARSAGLYLGEVSVPGHLVPSIRLYSPETKIANDTGEETGFGHTQEDSVQSVIGAGKIETALQRTDR